MHTYSIRLGKKRSAGNMHFRNNTEYIPKRHCPVCDLRAFSCASIPLVTLQNQLLFSKNSAMIHGRTF